MASNTVAKRITAGSPHVNSQNSGIKLKEFKNLFNSNLDLALLNCSIVNIPFEIDALINCTGPYFEHYVGISKAITDHAGPKLIKEYDIYMQKHGFLDYGAVHTTPAIGFDNHKFILHVRSPTNKHNILFKATRPLPLIELIYYNILKTSFIDSSLNTIALPLIGTGTVGVPITDSCNDLTMAILKILADFKDSMRNNEYKIYVINNIPSQLDQAETSLGQQISAHSKDILPIKEEKKSSVNKLEKIDRDNECIICLDTIINEKQLTKCSHSFCTKCIDDYFEKIKKMCPVCNTSYGLPYGDQPSGIMTSQMLNMSLPGFEQSGTIQINYHIPNGIQNAKHPNPGAAYFGTTRTAYLPDTDKGRKVHELLKKAFEYKLVFTIGQSRTTGLNDVVTWNDIHHKTNINGGPQVFGYPDPTYLNRVLEELALKGIS